MSKLDINSMHFPAKFVNVTNVDHKLGGAWFSPQKPLPLNRGFVEANLALLQDAVDRNILEFVDDEKPKREDKEPLKQEESVSKNDDSSDGGSLFDLHWAKAKKIIESIEDGQEIEKLIVEADERNIKEDHAIYKALIQRMEELSE